MTNKLRGNRETDQKIDKMLIERNKLLMEKNARIYTYSRDDKYRLCHNKTDSNIKYLYLKWRDEIVIIRISFAFKSL